MSYIVRSDHIAITSGDKSTTGSKVSVRVAPHVPRCLLSRCVILATRIVATGGFGKVIRVSHQILSSIAAMSCRPLPARADLLQVDPAWMGSQAFVFGRLTRPTRAGYLLPWPPSHPGPTADRKRLSAAGRMNG